MKCLTSLVSLFAITALARPLPGVPTTGTQAPQFAPPGWQLEGATPCELNGDAMPDLLIVLIEPPKEGKDADPMERRRALVWVHGTAKGYELVDSNVGLLPRYNGLGINGGEAAPEIEVSKRVASITLSGGSADAYGSVHRFRFEKGVVRLIGLDDTNYNRNTLETNSTSENLLTGVVEVSYEPPNDQPKKKAWKKRESKGVKPPVPLHDVVKYDDRG